MGNLLDHLQREEEMEEQAKHDAYCMDRFAKMSLLEDLYGKDELLYAFVEYLEKENEVVLDDILDSIVETALEQGDIE